MSPRRLLTCSLSFALASAAVGCSSTSADTPANDAGTEITWTSLYRDYFGKSPAPTCKGTGQCHGSAGEPGGAVWVCGDTQESCYRGMTSASPSIVNVADPDKSTLLSVALRTSKGGNMPFSPSSYVFTAADIARIRAWMAAGAKND